jgi:hypothetical protein
MSKLRGFYGFAPMHCRPNADKVCTKMTLDTFYATQDFGVATRQTYPIVKVRLPKERREAIILLRYTHYINLGGFVPRLSKGLLRRGGLIPMSKDRGLACYVCW